MSACLSFCVSFACNLLLFRPGRWPPVDAPQPDACSIRLARAQQSKLLAAASQPTNKQTNEAGAAAKSQFKREQRNAQNTSQQLTSFSFVESNGKEAKNICSSLLQASNKHIQSEHFSGEKRQLREPFDNKHNTAKEERRNTPLYYVFALAQQLYSSWSSQSRVQRRVRQPIE